MTQSSKLLINEPPLQVLPTLAKHLDINKAIILQQVQYWIVTSGHEIDGFRWIYNSYTEWSQQFPWLTARAVRWHIKGLEEAGYLITGEFNKDRRDNTKWYRLDYDKLEALPQPSGGVATTVRPSGNKRHLQVATNGKPLPETTTETTTETTRVSRLSNNPHIAEMQKFLGFPDRTKQDPIPNPAAEAAAIKKMERRGFTWKNISDLWKAKVGVRGEFVSMHFVNLDIGTRRDKDNGKVGGHHRPNSPEAIAASIGVPLD